MHRKIRIILALILVMLTLSFSVSCQKKSVAVTEEADLMVLACDYPRVTPALLSRLLERADAGAELVLVRDANGLDHPLVALWRRELQERVRDALRRETFRVRDLVGASAVQRLGPDALPGSDLRRELTNLNAPADLDRFGGLS